MNLSLDDDMGSIMDLNLMIPHEGMAKEISEKFRVAPEELYSQIMALLLADKKN